MNILGHFETEHPKHIMRRRLADEHGIAVEVLAEGQTLPEGVLYAGMLSWSLYRYLRPSTGAPVWGVELERFQGPDIHWWTTWIIDGSDPQPDAETVLALLDTEAGR